MHSRYWLKICLIISYAFLNTYHFSKCNCKRGFVIWFTHFHDRITWILISNSTFFLFFIFLQKTAKSCVSKWKISGGGSSMFWTGEDSQNLNHPILQLMVRIYSKTLRWKNWIFSPPLFLPPPPSLSLFTNNKIKILENWGVWKLNIWVLLDMLRRSIFQGLNPSPKLCKSYYFFCLTRVINLLLVRGLKKALRHYLKPR